MKINQDIGIYRIVLASESILKFKVSVSNNIPSELYESLYYRDNEILCILLGLSLFTNISIVFKMMTILNLGIQLLFCLFRERVNSISVIIITIYHWFTYHFNFSIIKDTKIFIWYFSYIVYLTKFNVWVFVVNILN